ncbi:hypothetical protein OGAPHI_005769 [Ogataea philodendri]|uniref:Uncharacterized protein n=1 Tax=Ogataea philodendri TaxID=1378263 RepID=A0A9P8P0C7_9ASCO|nr:uncharacterized protein OGAPHI_005769 [Ogataea philodendri]KAH3662517.1 hypothetical protein OGAPHI_005769 [Ogataea philodendri]
MVAHHTHATRSDGPRFVKHHAVDPVGLFQNVGSLDQNPVGSTNTGSNHHGSGGSQSERTGTGHHDHGNGHLQDARENDPAGVLVDEK